MKNNENSVDEKEDIRQTQMIEHDRSYYGMFMYINGRKSNWLIDSEYISPRFNIYIINIRSL